MLFAETLAGAGCSLVGAARQPLSADNCLLRSTPLSKRRLAYADEGSRPWRFRTSRPYAAEREHSAEQLDAQHADPSGFRTGRRDAEQADAMGDPGRATGG